MFKLPASGALINNNAEAEVQFITCINSCTAKSRMRAASSEPHSSEDNRFKTDRVCVRWFSSRARSNAFFVEFGVFQRHSRLTRKCRRQLNIVAGVKIGFGFFQRNYARDLSGGDQRNAQPG